MNVKRHYPKCSFEENMGRNLNYNELLSTALIVQALICQAINIPITIKMIFLLSYLRKPLC